MPGGILAGIRVVDLTSVVVGPTATLLLADYGAEVIKVEPPEGDLLRRLGGRSTSGQLSPKFLHFNRNKRSLALDLKRPRALDALRRLIAGADVCIANIRPRALARLGLGGAQAQALNPAIVYCNLVGFGEAGRYRGKPAYDTIIQGAGGIAAGLARSTGEPRFVPMVIADHLVGLIAAQMILLALYHRQATGEGQVVEVPMIENVAAFVMAEHMGQRTFDIARGETGDRRVLDPRGRPIPTKDGHICISANTDAQAFAFFEAIGRPELARDPRFASVKARLAHVEDYFQLRAEALSGRGTAEWLAIFDRLDVPAAPYHSFETLLEDGHLADVGLFQTRRHPAEGPIIDIALPNRMSAGGPRRDWRPAPLLGADTREILAGLGYDAAAIAEMIAAGEAVAPPDSG